jgi:hypothetical protein
MYIRTYAYMSRRTGCRIGAFPVAPHELWHGLKFRFPLIRGWRQIRVADRSAEAHPRQLHSPSRSSDGWLSHSFVLILLSMESVDSGKCQWSAQAEGRTLQTAYALCCSYLGVPATPRDQGHTHSTPVCRLQAEPACKDHDVPPLSGLRQTNGRRASPSEKGMESHTSYTSAVGRTRTHRSPLTPKLIVASCFPRLCVGSCEVNQTSWG